MKKLWRLNLNHLFLPISIVLIVLIFMFRGQSQIQFEIVVLATMFYLTSAMIHHYFDKSLTFEVMIEYILIAILSIIVILGVLV